LQVTGILQGLNSKRLTFFVHINLTQKDEQLLASSHGKGCTVFPTSIESIPSLRKTSIRVPDAVKRHSMRAYNVQSMLTTVYVKKKRHASLFINLRNDI